ASASCPEMWSSGAVRGIPRADGGPPRCPARSRTASLGRRGRSASRRGVRGGPASSAGARRQDSTRDRESEKERRAMDHLPSAEEQDWLLERLGELIAARGYATFVTAPILEPSDRFFPDEFSPDVRGIYILARRMLTYAGLGQLDVQVEVFDPGSVVKIARGG